MLSESAGKGPRTFSWILYGLRAVRPTYEARPLQQRGRGAQHARVHDVVDEAGTLEVGQHFHRELLQRGTGLAERERRDAPSEHRALLAHVRRGACGTTGKLNKKKKKPRPEPETENGRFSTKTKFLKKPND